MAKRNLTYSEALDELNRIVSAFEQGQLPLDEITAQLERAQFLLQFCTDKVQQVKTDVQQILNDEQE